MAVTDMTLTFDPGEVVDALGLEEHRGKPVKQLSKGNRQRLGIAQALLSDAGVVVFLIGLWLVRRIQPASVQ